MESTVFGNSVFSGIRYRVYNYSFMNREKEFRGIDR